MATDEHSQLKSNESYCLGIYTQVYSFVVKKNQWGLQHLSYNGVTGMATAQYSPQGPNMTHW